MDRISVRHGLSTSSDPATAVAEVHAAIFQPDIQAVIFFCSSSYDCDALALELNAAFECETIGCTTAGELTAAGLHSGSLAAVSIASAELRMHTALISPLSGFGREQAHVLATRLHRELKLVEPTDTNRQFGFLLIDGLSLSEETVANALYWQFHGTRIVGGSAGDDMNYRATRVYRNGEFRSDAAVFALFETTLPFEVFKTQHFIPTEELLVITSSDPATRTIYEINGMPAADEYARCLGTTFELLTPELYSSQPLVFTVHGELYVRSVAKVNPDHSLTFFAAIDDGLVLQLGQAGDLVADLKQEISTLRETVPNLQLVLGCDCILRRLEIQARQLEPQVREALQGLSFLGFSTYGEQFNGMHVNQTLTGVAIGA